MHRVVAHDTLYDAGDGSAGSNLALLPATDYTPPNLSHFTSHDYSFASALEMLDTGWLGRSHEVRASPRDGDPDHRGARQRRRYTGRAEPWFWKQPTSSAGTQPNDDSYGPAVIREVAAHATRRRTIRPSWGRRSRRSGRQP